MYVTLCWIVVACRGGSTVGAEGAPAPLLPKTPWKIEVRRREKKRKERREEEERGGWRKKKGDEPPQRANPGSATACAGSGFWSSQKVERRGEIGKLEGRWCQLLRRDLW